MAIPVRLRNFSCSDLFAVGFLREIALEALIFLLLLNDREVDLLRPGTILSRILLFLFPTALVIPLAADSNLPIRFDDKQGHMDKHIDGEEKDERPSE